MSAPQDTLFHIRFATSHDVAGILAVYSPFIETPVTFEEEVPSLKEFSQRVADIQQTYPYLVVEAIPSSDEPSESCLVGYAYAHAQRERAAYAWNAELSIYLAPQAQGHGVGVILYQALMSLLEVQGIKSVHGFVTVPNPASEHLHKRFGFEHLTTQRQAGYTCNGWHDVAWLVKHLTPYENDPKPVVPFPTLAKTQSKTVKSILAQANEELC